MANHSKAKTGKLAGLAALVVLIVVAAWGLRQTGSDGALVGEGDDYPDKPLSLTVAYGPGGATDLQARIAVEPAAEVLGQPVKVVNRPGAGGRVGWNWAVDSGGRDGYELIAYNLPHMIAQWTHEPSLSYNADNVVPVANWGADPAVLVVGKDSPFQTVADVVDYARAHPGELSVSGAGLYTGHHVAALQFQRAAGVDINFLPAEQGGVQALQFVIGGQVQAGFNNLSDSWRNRDSLKILAVADTERSEFLPDVPTFQEAGVEVDDLSTNLRGVAVVKGVPEPHVERLAEKLPEVFRLEQVQTKLKNTGSGSLVLGPRETRELFERKTRAIKALLAQDDAP
ncbi:tripartite tricarboxylate transporter substrate binding protein [Alloalcanivorax sp. C16-2]|uniref:tripartite tricarboxylate transporter substrate binding protein n=1 Tax=Alloalcanivorax sp. C16-2 TaxID=3390052 RepID=UPI0039710AB4